jgi:hypothetical protein
MIMFEAGDDLDLRLEPKEHIVIFVCFDHECAAVPGTRIHTQIVNHATDNERGITTEILQHPGGHPSRGGLPMRACDGNTDLVCHQLTEEICPLINGDSHSLRRLDLRVVFRDRRRAHNPIGTFQIAWMVADIHGRAGFANFIGKRRHGAVRSAHRVAALQEEAGDGGKSAAPDANEMDVCHSSDQLSAFSN